jgi:hypothetical protein
MIAAAMIWAAVRVVVVAIVGQWWLTSLQYTLGRRLARSNGIG